MIELDLSAQPLRAINRALHAIPAEANDRDVHIANPKGTHSIAVGLDAPLSVTIEGHTGFYCGGMNKQADIVVINGHAGPGVAENMMSGPGPGHRQRLPDGRRLRPRRPAGDRGRCLLALRHLHEGHRHRGPRQGSVGHMSAFMAQKGHLVVCGDAGAATWGIRSTRR